MRWQAVAAVSILSGTVAGLRRGDPKGALKGEPAASVGTCGAKGGDDSTYKPMIVNGRDAEECEWRWQVGLRDPGVTGTPWCGGMLIDPEWVLTAAHCLVGARSVDIVAGLHSIFNGRGLEQVRRSAEIFLHPHYDAATTRYDFALVRLAEPVTVNECVGTVCLPSAGEEVAPGTKCWITGWGTLKSGGDQAHTLQEAEVSIVSNRDCFDKFDYSFHDLHPSMVCAQGINDDGKITDACQGDSGGPLVCETAPGKWTLHGATSFGRGCAAKTYPGIWARVERAVEWIQEVQAGNSDFVPTTPAPLRCPGQAMISLPDENGDCMCPLHRYCSADGGESYNCPRFDTFKYNPLGRQLFGYDCADCECYNWLR